MVVCQDVECQVEPRDHPENDPQGTAQYWKTTNAFVEAATAPRNGDVRSVDALSLHWYPW